MPGEDAGHTPLERRPAGNTGGRATRGFALSARDFKEIENVQDETVEKTAARPCSPQSHPEPFPPGLHRRFPGGEKLADPTRWQVQLFCKDRFLIFRPSRLPTGPE